MPLFCRFVLFLLSWARVTWLLGSSALKNICFSLHWLLDSIVPGMSSWHSGGHRQGVSPSDAIYSVHSKRANPSGLGLWVRKAWQVY